MRRRQIYAFETCIAALYYGSESKKLSLTVRIRDVVETQARHTAQRIVFGCHENCAFFARLRTITTDGQLEID